MVSPDSTKVYIANSGDNTVSVMMSNLLMFAAAAAAVLAIPGPTNTVLAASGALAGVRRSLPLIFAARKQAEVAAAAGDDCHLPARISKR